MGKKIGFLFGDFDPIFIEQIQMCEDVLHEFALDKVMLAPFGLPRRNAEQMTTYIDNRKDMIKLATWRNPRVSLLEEFDVKDTFLSTQLDIINKMEAKYNADVYYIMTSNHFLNLPDKENLEDLMHNRNIIIVMRPFYTLGVNTLASSFALKYNSQINISSSAKCTLSATVIRAYIQMGVINEMLLPLNVIEYINKNILYKMHSRLFEKVRELEPAPIYSHTVATCLNCAELAQLMDINQNEALLAGLLHNIGKCYTIEGLEKAGVYVPESYKRTDLLSMHGYMSELASKYFMGITNPDILSAIKYHSTGKADMKPLDILLFVAANLASSHISENYELIKARFFENPGTVFFNMLDKKFHSSRNNLPLLGFPKDLKEAHSYYSKKRNLNKILKRFSRTIYSQK